MKLYIFNSVNNKYRIPFRLFVINQNLKVARLTSVLVMCICALALLSEIFVDYSFVAEKVQYRYALSTLFAVSLIYFVALMYVKKLSTRRRMAIKHFIGTSYPLIIIYSMMWMSFLSGRSPANNMTMFMFGLLFVSVSWLFSIRSAIAITTLTYIGLSIGLNIFIADTKTIILNQVAGAIIVTGFYFISRMLYSYHANYFIQLKQIERNNHEITKMAHLKTEMLGIVAHDLRSPINSVSALVELSNGVNTSQTEREEYNNMILEACDEARNIIRDLILIVKGESAQGLQLKEVNMNIFLSEIQQHWTPQVKDDKKILLTLPEDIISIHIDKDKMLRVFDNLISNAIKFTEDGAKIRLTLSMAGKDMVKVVVSDDGIGIPEHMQPYLFDRFTKAGRLGLKGEKSHGLGLNICKQIIEHHGGKIKLESVVGEGTHFHITMPVKPAVQSAIPIPTEDMEEQHTA